MKDILILLLIWASLFVVVGNLGILISRYTDTPSDKAYCKHSIIYKTQTKQLTGEIPEQCKSPADQILCDGGYYSLCY